MAKPSTVRRESRNAAIAIGAAISIRSRRVRPAAATSAPRAHARRHVSAGVRATSIRVASTA